MSELGRVGVITDTGRKRRRNEDAYVVRAAALRDRRRDGRCAGGRGSVQARRGRAQGEWRGHRRRGACRGLIQEANRRVYDRSSRDPDTSGMGTTITVALVEDGHVAFGHVGDSRAYLIRDGRMEQ